MTLYIEQIPVDRTLKVNYNIHIYRTHPGRLQVIVKCPYTPNKSRQTTRKISLYTEKSLVDCTLNVKYTYVPNESRQVTFKTIFLRNFVYSLLNIAQEFQQFTSIWMKSDSGIFNVVRLRSCGRGKWGRTWLVLVTQQS